MKTEMRWKFERDYLGWLVTDGERSFRASNVYDAEWLCDHLNLSTN